MSIKPIIQRVESNNTDKFKKDINMHQVTYPVANDTPCPMPKSGSNVTFGSNPIVGLMDVIETGGYATSFIIQDGIGFIAPRVGKGLLRGGPEKRDENGNVVLGKNGKPEHELNWQFARKEFLREIITGPSAFLIPLGLLKFIKNHYGEANNVKINYIDSFQNSYLNFVKNNNDLIQSGNTETGKGIFYKEVLKNVIENSINKEITTDSEKLTQQQIEKIADELANKQVKIENIMSDKSLNKASKKAKIKELGGPVEGDFMSLKKSLIGGSVDETSVALKSSKNQITGGSISEVLKAMNNYFNDITKTVVPSLKDDLSAKNIEDTIKNFTHNKMGSRLLTNFGLFGAVALFYTQIPKMYNIGLKGNPALNQTSGENQKNASEVKKDIAFTGLVSKAGDVAEKTFGNKVMKYISDMFELNGPVISGGAMSTLLYGFCIPPRLKNAQDKYDFGEILFRDFVAFTTLLYGAKAVARLSTDLFTKLTGLALNHKKLEGKTLFQKFIAYVQPSDAGHSILSSGQLESKYTNIHKYKDGVNGFVKFIKDSGGNLKKAFAKDKNVKQAIDEILQKYLNKTYANASNAEIEDVLRLANKDNGELIKNFYKLFEKENGMLKWAKTCNSAFGFASTIVLVPGLIMWLTHACEKMTERRIKKENGGVVPNKRNINSAKYPTNAPSMAGFLGKAIN